MKLFTKIATTAILTMGFAATSNSAPIIFQGLDVGASSFAAGTNSQAASNSFDLASGPLSIIDFDTNTTGATLSPSSSPQGCGFALCGGNTTVGGSNFFGHVFTTTITFDSGIDSFGAYFTGWQRSTQTLEYSDGSTVTLNMPAGDLSSGGMVFFGFIDSGATINSITYNTVSGDFVGIDDMRFGTAASAVPEPTTLALMSLGLYGLISFNRRRRVQ